MCNEKEKFIEPYNRIRKEQFLKDLREDPEFRAAVVNALDITTAEDVANGDVPLGWFIE